MFYSVQFSLKNNKFKHTGQGHFFMFCSITYVQEPKITGINTAQYWRKSTITNIPTHNTPDQGHSVAFGKSHQEP